MTFSIVARDKKTGFLGVAVHSHTFSIGSYVPFGRAGVGVVVSQALAHPSYGPLAVHLLSIGRSAESTLLSLLSSDENANRSQVSVLGSSGKISTYTGKKCIPQSGHRTGKNASCQGNMLANDSVWDSMLDAFERSGHLEFAEKLVFALESGHTAGGDIRGVQSSAIQIFSGVVAADPWTGRLLDLRVEDHPDAIRELKRLVRLKRAYAESDMGEELLLLKSDPAKSAKAYERAAKLAPEVEELKYWSAISKLSTKKAEEGISDLNRLFRRNRAWFLLTKNLVATGHLPNDNSLLQRLGII